jgi:hypothetical protein
MEDPVKVNVVPPRTETKVVEVAPERITLEVTREEAEFITTLIGKVVTRDIVNVFPGINTETLYSALYDAGLYKERYDVGRIVATLGGEPGYGLGLRYER